ncbi:hypothetical protein Ga0100231_005230 [Opitutaceae bacterium TAV4]|uniref:hypothetical protein n=1 Tax=Geminisphaera colitermitum TaxID=1148786 RepID=UPI000158CEF5|nr:hypothetical protein [Geminisphaera colitermitum]RRJ97862.1 hypothetical protein Ga0100231_005230 [Opitutaceae bacterium TAV4]RRK02391.1 hypothetical protein Ga0100230_004350 [Opitutaceae bacterium TAV3]
MSNEPTHEPTQLTQFQQRAQLRLREKEAEWRRTLFERFRHICREEMMDVMKTLLDTLPSPQELELRQEELLQSQQSRQTMLATLDQTSRKMTELAERIEKLPMTTVDTSALERETKEMVERQEQQTNRILAQQENTFRDILTHTHKSAKTTILIVGLICLGAIAGLKYLGNFTLVNETDIAAQNRLAMDVQTNLTLLESQRAALLTEIKELTTTRETLQTELRQNIELQTTVQQQTASLQRLQEEFRFQLVKGATGGVFVEIQPEAQPFDYEGKTYIQVR